MKLNVWYKDKIIGLLKYNEEKNKEFSFQYTQDWLASLDCFSLSPQFDVANKASVYNFFENLLPEGEALYAINEKLGRRMSDSFGLLSILGSDLPCAFQILPENTKPTYTGEVQEFSFADLENYHGSLLLFSNKKYLSLAGGQNKMGAIFKDDKFYLPLDSTPTTHIIKKYDDKHPYCALNEFLMMKLAAKLGINVPDVSYYKDYIIIERYDRDNGQRLHQIDLCQFYNRPSREKYEEYNDFVSEDKGLVLKDYFNALKHYEGGQDKLLTWICFNYLIGNTDNHGKNVSLLYKNNTWDIAPFYDLVCTSIYNYGQLPYTINGENNVFCINESDFLHAMEENGINPEKFINIYTELQKAIPDLFHEVVKENNITAPFTDQLLDELMVMNSHLNFKE